MAVLRLQTDGRCVAKHSEGELSWRISAPKTRPSLSCKCPEGAFFFGEPEPWNLTHENTPLSSHVSSSVRCSCPGESCHVTAYFLSPAALVAHPLGRRFSRAAVPELQLSRRRPRWDRASKLLGWLIVSPLLVNILLASGKLRDSSGKLRSKTLYIDPPFAWRTIPFFFILPFFPTN